MGSTLSASPAAFPRVVAVTGALGFVADRLLPHLAARDVHVLAVVRPGRSIAAIEPLARIEVRTGSLDDERTLSRTFVGAEAVVHLAGMALAPAMLPALEVAGVGRGVFVSSAGVYTRLTSSGADAKRRGEARLEASPLAGTVLRPSMIYGTPRDRNMVRLLRWIERWRVVPAPLGGITPQQPVHVDDLVQAIVAALAHPAPGFRSFDVGGPDPVTLRELIQASARALGRRSWVLPLPLAPAHAASLLARRLRLPFPVSPEQVLRLAESKAVDIGPAAAALGFSPRPFAEGIAAEAEWLRTGREPESLRGPRGRSRSARVG